MASKCLNTIFLCLNKIIEILFVEIEIGLLPVFFICFFSKSIHDFRFLANRKTHKRLFERNKIQDNVSHVDAEKGGKQRRK